MRTLPILFNTDMVRALLEGRKSVTRRVIKPQPEGAALKALTGDAESRTKLTAACTPYRPGDILYVRETWCNVNKPGFEPEYYYFADTKYVEDYYPREWTWRPSIHMPKEAARIFLRVTGVRVERLNAITEDQAGAEGAGDPYDYQAPEWYEKREELAYSSRIAAFAGLWDTTVKPADRDKYGWDADPWVWVIEFERVSREEAEV